MKPRASQLREEIRLRLESRRVVLPASSVKPGDVVEYWGLGDRPGVRFATVVHVHPRRGEVRVEQRVRLNGTTRVLWKGVLREQQLIANHGRRRLRELAGGRR